MSQDSFIDGAFPPNENSLMGKSKDGNFLDPIESRRKIYRDSDAEWKRISEIIPKPVIYEGTINMDTIKYGRISLQYFYSVLSALANSYPSIFTKIILSKDYDPKGMYQVKLYIDGEFQTIIIDDYFPCIKGSNVNFFTRPSNFEIWPLLIEKAWAKVNGGYLNIVNLWPGDLFKTLTGFSFDELVHPQLTKEQLFNQICNKNKNKDLFFSLTKDDKKIEEKGLYIYHVYIIEDTEKIEIDNNKIYLLKLRDSDNESNWSGDYNPKSNLWTEKLKSKIDKNKLNLKEGEFWISLDDFHNLFLRTDACHMLTDGFTTCYQFEKEQINTPKIFNLFVQENGILSISILEKNWHFHRELRNVSHPTSLIIAEYDTTKKKILNIDSSYESNEDLEITKLFKKGYYLIWAYKTKDPNESFNIEEMNIKICTLCKASIEHIGDDINFDFLRNMIYQNILEKNKDKIKKDDFFYAVDNSFDKSGIGYQMVFNPLKNIHQVWKVDSSATHGFLILPPHNKTEFEVTVGYEDYQIILGIKKYKYGKHCVNLGIEASVFRGSQDPPKVEPKQNLDKFFSWKNLTEIKENSTFNSTEIKKSEKYPILNHWELFLEKHKNKYPFIIEELKKLKALTDENFDLNIIENIINKNLYIGEADYGIRYGRGAYIFGREGTTYIGYWESGLQFVKGKVFDKNNKLIFEGEYKNGLREGKGVYNYEGGEKYEGMFANGLKHGKGVFTWKNGLKWDGAFKMDEFDGEGTFHDGQESFKATFKDGNLVEN